MHILGAGGHAKVVIDIATALKRDIEGIWADNLDNPFFKNFPIKEDIGAFKEKELNKYVIAIGNNLIRKKIALQLKPTKIFLAHPTSSISTSVQIDSGTVIMPNSSINSCSIIGKHVIINTNASVDHDCEIGDFVHVSPQAGLGGHVQVGEGTHIGIGSSVIQGIKIGKWATIGAGAVIIKDVPDYAVVVGNPGKIIKYNKNEY